MLLGGKVEQLNKSSPALNDTASPIKSTLHSRPDPRLLGATPRPAAVGPLTPPGPGPKLSMRFSRQAKVDERCACKFLAHRAYHNQGISESQIPIDERNHKS